MVRNAGGNGQFRDDDERKCSLHGFPLWSGLSSLYNSVIVITSRRRQDLAHGRKLLQNLSEELWERTLPLVLEYCYCSSNCGRCQCCVGQNNTVYRIHPPDNLINTLHQFSHIQTVSVKSIKPPLSYCNNRAVCSSVPIFTTCHLAVF